MTTIIAADLKENPVSEVFSPCSQGHISKQAPPLPVQKAPALPERIIPTETIVSILPVPTQPSDKRQSLHQSVL